MENESDQDAILNGQAQQPPSSPQVTPSDQDSAVSESSDNERQDPFIEPQRTKKQRNRDAKIKLQKLGFAKLAFPYDNVTMVDGRILINGLCPGSSALPTVPGANESITVPSSTVATDSKATVPKGTVPTSKTGNTSPIDVSVSALKTETEAITKLQPQTPSDKEKSKVQQIVPPRPPPPSLRGRQLTIEPRAPATLVQSPTPSTRPLRSTQASKDLSSSVNHSSNNADTNKNHLINPTLK